MSDKHNKRAPFPQRRLLASAVSLALLSGFAVAQESAVELDDVTVQGQQDKGFKVDKASSPKQTAALLDTPQTVNVIPETLFRQQNARTLRCTAQYARHQLRGWRKRFRQRHQQLQPARLQHQRQRFRRWRA